MKNFIKQDLVEVMSRYIELIPKGNYYVAFCPFHTNVNTPALIVYPNDGPETAQWQCTSECNDGKWHDVIDFVKLIEDCSFAEALNICANIATVSDTFLRELDKPHAKDQDLLLFAQRGYDLIQKADLSAAQVVLRQVDDYLAEGRILDADRLLRSHKV